MLKVRSRGPVSLRRPVPPASEVLLDDSLALQQARDLLEGKARLLNHEVSMSPPVGWTEQCDYLRAYALHAFEYLESLRYLVRSDPSRKLQAVSCGRALIQDWVSRHPYPAQPGWEPYPTSLRLTYWSRFLSDFPESANAPVLNSMKRQLLVLSDNVEHDLANNHVIENLAGILLAGSLLAGNSRIRRSVSYALTHFMRVLGEQLAPDGSLAERSAMYHCLVLSRLLMLQPPARAGVLRLPGLDAMIERMLEALRGYLLPDGSLPHLHDSTCGVAPVAHRLFAAAGKNPLPRHDKIHQVGGLVVFRSGRWYCVVDAAGPAPSHNPAHVHACAGAFVLYRNDRKLITDPGVSTYRRGPRRTWERSTVAHNALCVDATDQSEVFAGFRIGRRAKVSRHIETHRDGTTRISVRHDGYRRLAEPVEHMREFSAREDSLVVRDVLHGRGKHTVSLLLTLAPGISPRPLANGWQLDARGTILRVEWGPSATVRTVDTTVSQGFCHTCSTTGLMLTAEVSLPWQGALKFFIVRPEG
ncbi:MAG: heparinase II/III family protein [Phycisphaerae bacterium]